MILSDPAGLHPLQIWPVQPSSDGRSNRRADQASGIGEHEE